METSIQHANPGSGILIIDNKLAFIGGVNIKENIRHWVDLQIKLEGRIVQPLLQSFAYAYKMVGGKKEGFLSLSNIRMIMLS